VQVWVHVSSELREVVVAFRGTEQVRHAFGMQWIVVHALVVHSCTRVCFQRCRRGIRDSRTGSMRWKLTRCR
jgi:hypothetical protein